MPQGTILTLAPSGLPVTWRCSAAFRTETEVQLSSCRRPISLCVSTLTKTRRYEILKISENTPSSSEASKTSSLFAFLISVRRTQEDLRSRQRLSGQRNELRVTSFTRRLCLPTACRTPQSKCSSHAAISQAYASREPGLPPLVPCNRGTSQFAELTTAAGDVHARTGTLS